MSQNFFLDNPDLQLRLEHLDLREVLELKEKGYAESDVYPTAPRNYADAKDNYRIVLDVLGEICGERVAPRAAEADEEGAHYEDGEVTYAAATLDAIEALRQETGFFADQAMDAPELSEPAEDEFTASDYVQDSESSAAQRRLMEWEAAMREPETHGRNMTQEPSSGVGSDASAGPDGGPRGDGLRS